MLAFRLNIIHLISPVIPRFWFLYPLLSSSISEFGTQDKIFHEIKNRINIKYAYLGK